MGRYVVAVSGASGSILAYRTLLALGELGHQIELVMSSSSLYTAQIELDQEIDSVDQFTMRLPKSVQMCITSHQINNVGASIASGSYQTDGMLIIPCSMATVAAINAGLGDNLLRRAADVTIKEKRTCVIVPRETPMSPLHLTNLLNLSKLGVQIVLPIPAWYIKPKTVEDLENFIVGKAFDALGVTHDLYPRWR